MSASETATATLSALSDSELRDHFTAVLKEYVARQVDGERFAPIDDVRVSATEGVVAASAILDTLNVEVFELGMWKSWGMV
jgi:hypothetical protein